MHYSLEKNIITVAIASNSTQLLTAKTPQNWMKMQVSHRVWYRVNGGVLLQISPVIMSVNHIKSHKTKGSPWNPYGHQPTIKLNTKQLPAKSVGDNDGGWMISSYLLSISFKSVWYGSNSKLITETSFWKINRKDLIGSRWKILRLYLQRSTHFIHFHIWLTWHFQKIYMVSDKSQNTIDFFTVARYRNMAFYMQCGHRPSDVW